MRSFEEICNAFLVNGDVSNKNLVIILKEGFVTCVERRSEGQNILKVVEGSSRESIRVNCRYNVSVGGEDISDPELEFFQPASKSSHFYVRPSQIADYEILS